MQDYNPQTQPVDPLLRQAFQVIKQTPLRLAQDRHQGLQNFVREADRLFLEVSGDAIGFPSQSKINFNMIKEVFGLMNLKMRPLFTALSAIMLAFVFLFGGVGMTAYAAQSALPGDNLYAFKTGLEATRASLAKDQVKQIELYLNFAQLRLDEISDLIQSGRFMDIPQATAEFETYLDKALAALQLLAQNDPVRAAEYNFQVADTLSRFNQILSGMLASVPASAQNALLSAIDASATLSDVDGDDDSLNEDQIDYSHDDSQDDSHDDSLDDGQDDDILDDDQDDDSLDDGQDDDSLDDQDDDGQDDDSLDDGQDDDSLDDGQDDDSLDDGQDDDGQEEDSLDDGQYDDSQDDDSQDDDSQDDDSLDDGQDDDSQDDDDDDDDDDESNQDS